jgi:hypothetical protein
MEQRACNHSLCEQYGYSQRGSCGYGRHILYGSGLPCNGNCHG